MRDEDCLRAPVVRRTDYARVTDPRGPVPNDEMLGALSKMK
jgi:hypothetical protein